MVAGKCEEVVYLQNALKYSSFSNTMLQELFRLSLNLELKNKDFQL